MFISTQKKQLFTSTLVGWIWLAQWRLKWVVLFVTFSGWNMNQNIAIVLKLCATKSVLIQLSESWIMHRHLWVSVLYFHLEMCIFAEGNTGGCFPVLAWSLHYWPTEYFSVLKHHSNTNVIFSTYELHYLLIQFMVSKFDPRQTTQRI